MEKLGRHGARLKDLRRRVRNRPEGQVVVDGRRLVADVVRWGVPVLELYLAEGVEPDPEIAAAAGEVFTVDSAVLDEIAPTRHPQGVLAVVADPRLPPWPGREGVALWLDTVQDPGNLGAIVRSSAALGARAVLLSPGCADPFHPAAVRGSAGAVFRLPLTRDVTAARVAERMSESGGEVWAAGPGGTPVDRWRPSPPLVLLLGAEGAGLSPEALAVATGEVTIPLDREVESLNVAVAAGVLLERLRSS
ncbi:MAG: RNA methyltransferase [Thermoanaerobaculales bacterium]|jgi:TrmH family RNA methyltransferase|nr:RNA methyltransferase [Thermoanaerobaculales bacterium]